MPAQEPPQIDIYDAQTHRTKQYDHMELLVAMSEVEIICAEWFVDQRTNSASSAQAFAS